MPGGLAGAGAEVGDVVVGSAGGFGGLGEDAEVAGRGEAAFVGVQHVHPGQLLAVQGLYPDLDLAVHVLVDRLPLVQPLDVLGVNVVQRDEDLVGRVGRVLDNGG